MAPSRLARSLAVRVARYFGYVSALFILAALPNAPGIFPTTRAQNMSNSDPTYQALRSLTLGQESVTVSNLDFKRDAATFHLRAGTVCFVAPVAGKVTGAVFTGDGNLALSVPPVEKGMLKLLTKEDEFSENFNQMVLRFTDSTYEELQKAGTAGAGNCGAGPLKDSQRTTRHDLRENLEARILEDVLSSEPGGLFMAFIHGKRYSDKELFAIDPHLGVDQVRFITYADNKIGEWASFRMSGVRSRVGMRIRIGHQQLDSTIENNAELTGKATTTFVSRFAGLRVVSLDLFPTLRVQSVTADGAPLAFIQEDKNEDADFAVILPKELAADQTFTVTTTYKGKDAVKNEGNGNYYPASRENWFPNNPVGELGEFTSYDMTFHIPKGLKMAATGELVSESNDAGHNVTVWKSEAPQTVAGFNFGRFKLEEAKLANLPYVVQSYANQDLPDWIHDVQLRASVTRGDILGSMNTTLLNKKALAEGQVAMQLYTEYFGPPLFKHLQITQQSACDFGQAWPGLVWIPICYYFDTTVRHALGLDLGDRGYWNVVTPHEVAHQWWGHTVGFNSYRDQWMSEGFADMSASLYLTVIDKNIQPYLKFWNDERTLLTERNAEGFRAIDAGPLTMGYRLGNSRTGFNIPRRLIYPKGAYILQMLRMMMHDTRTGDQRFKEMMHNFVSVYAGKPATTEDFKAMVEKHMIQYMDLDGNGKMDWFFNEYVYGTQLPSYKVEASFETGADGDVILNANLTQSGVEDSFRMLVPLYLELADGNIVFFARVRMAGNSSASQKISLKGVKAKPRRLLVNYYDDVLASPN